MKKLLTAAVFGCLVGAVVSAEILEQVLVKVNGEIVTQTEFHKIQFAALRELQNQPDPGRVTDAELSKLLAQVTPQAIVTLVDEMLLMQRAKELSLAVGRASLRCSSRFGRTTNRIQEAFEAALKTDRHDAPATKQMISKQFHRPGAAARNGRCRGDEAEKT